jgi:predicted DNA-binding transcriptional regulator AlpA
MTRILLTEEQVSKATSLKPSTLKKRRQFGLPPRFLKIGSKVVYDQKDVDAFLDSCIRESTAPLKPTSKKKIPTKPLNQSSTDQAQEGEA